MMRRKPSSTCSYCGRPSAPATELDIPQLCEACMFDDEQEIKALQRDYAQAGARFIARGRE